MSCKTHGVGGEIFTRLIALEGEHTRAWTTTSFILSFVTAFGSSLWQV